MKKTLEWSRVPMVGLLVTAAVVACSSPSGIEGGPDGVEHADNLQVQADEAIFVLTQLKDMHAYPEALYRGGLHVDGRGCIRLTESGGQTTVVWPAGFTVSRSGERIEVLDPEGRVVGDLDQEFETGGGELPHLDSAFGFTQRDQDLASSRCPGNFWLVTPGTVTAD